MEAAFKGGQNPYRVVEPMMIMMMMMDMRTEKAAT
jgi:hypothetical protein